MLWRRRIDGLAFALARYRLFTCPPQVRLRPAGKGAPPSHTRENPFSMRVEIAQHVARPAPAACARHCSLVSSLTRWWVSRACITPRAQRCAWCSVRVIRSLIYEYLSVCRRFSFRTHRLVLVCPPQCHTSSQSIMIVRNKDRMACLRSAGGSLRAYVRGAGSVSRLL